MNANVFPLVSNVKYSHHLLHARYEQQNCLSSLKSSFICFPFRNIRHIPSCLHFTLQRIGRANAVDAPAGERPPECKQQ